MMLNGLAVTTLLFIIFGISKCSAQGCKADEDKDWYYASDLPNGPDNWEDKYPDCKKDKQSPIDIKTSDVEPMKDSDGVQYENYDTPMSKVQIENLGFTVRVRPKDDVKRSVIFNNTSYKLLEINFRWGNKSKNDDGDEVSTPGSDHKIDGKQFVLEMEVSHISESKELLAISVLFDDSDDANPDIDVIQKPLDKCQYENDTYEGDMKDDYSVSIMLSNLVPNDTSYYMYNGSMIQPPCKEDVIWLIAQEPSTVSSSQMFNFEDLYSVTKDDVGEDGAACHIVNNFRPTQPLNDRTVYST